LRSIYLNRGLEDSPGDSERGGLIAAARNAGHGSRLIHCGIATVSIDGGTATTVDTAGSTAPGTRGLTSEVVFTAVNLTDDLHALRITVTGNSSSSGGRIVVDAFDVTDGAAATDEVAAGRPTRCGSRCSRCSLYGRAGAPVRGDELSPRRRNGISIGTRLR
jgi:hypothetical protein